MEATTPMFIDCRLPGWKESLRAALKAKLDADVVSLPLNAQQFCQQMALMFGCDFEMDSLGEVAFIRQCDSTTPKVIRPEYRNK